VPGSMVVETGPLLLRGPEEAQAASASVSAMVAKGRRLMESMRATLREPR
jgi:hypothetical protein